jgi:hypothetical protein
VGQGLTELNIGKRWPALVENETELSIVGGQNQFDFRVEFHYLLGDILACCRVCGVNLV